MQPSQANCPARGLIVAPGGVHKSAHISAISSPLSSPPPAWQGMPGTWTPCFALLLSWRRNLWILSSVAAEKRVRSLGKRGTGLMPVLTDSTS